MAITVRGRRRAGEEGRDGPVQCGVIVIMECLPLCAIMQVRELPITASQKNLVVSTPALFCLCVSLSFSLPLGLWCTIGCWCCFYCFTAVGGSDRFGFCILPYQTSRVEPNIHACTDTHTKYLPCGAGQPIH